MSQNALLTFDPEVAGVRLNMKAVMKAVVVVEPLRGRKPSDPFVEEPETALESPYELEDCIEDVLQRMPRRQARIVRLSLGLSSGAGRRQMEPDEISRLLSYPGSKPKMEISEDEVKFLLAEGKALLCRDARLREARAALVP